MAGVGPAHPCRLERFAEGFRVPSDAVGEFRGGTHAVFVIVDDVDQQAQHLGQLVDDFRVQDLDRRCGDVGDPSGFLLDLLDLRGDFN